MIRRLLPAPRLPHDLDAAARFGDRRCRPDMVEAAAAVGCCPIARPVAPPSIELLIGRNMVAHDIDPAACGLRPREARSLGGSMTYDFEKLFVRPDIVLERRHIEIANHQRMLISRHRAVP